MGITLIMPSLKLQPNPASNFELIYLCDVVKQKYQTLAGNKFRRYEKFSSLGHVSSKWPVIKKCRHDLGQEPQGHRSQDLRPVI